MPRKVQTAVSKYLRILSKIRGGGNGATVLVETGFSATIIVCLIYNVMWRGGSVKCGSL